MTDASTSRDHFAAAILAALLFALATTHPARAEPAQVEELSRLSLEQLANVEVTSVSKAAQPLLSAPATIYVIHREDLLRSGATQLAEALRLAPNLQVTQVGANNHVVTARGFGGSPEAQNFSNKLLVLIDGRSVYTPLFSGIYYDAQDVMMDDVERIEVISGPGATLWGANAMNGVINVITRDAAASRGALLRAGGGNDERSFSARLGGGDDGAAWRAYAKGLERDELALDEARGAGDGWRRAQAGFRVDWSRARDHVRTQGDLYRGDLDRSGDGASTISGANLLADWRRDGDRGQTKWQAYFDQTERAAPPGGVAFVLRTWDLTFQQNVTLGGRHDVVWGAGYRLNRYAITNSEALAFEPPRRSLDFGNLYAQDTVALGAAWKLTVGLKLEEDPYSGWTPLPDLRLSRAIGDSGLLWASGSRAIRAATPFDVDVVERLGGAVFLRGNPDFAGEKVTTWQVGWRDRPTAATSVSLTAFYNDYDDLRSIEGFSPTRLLPLTWGNLMRGNSYGLEAWADLELAPWWRLSPGFRALNKRLGFAPGSTRLLGVAQAGNDPRRQALLKSSMDFGHGFSLDAQLRWVDQLPAPLTGAYYELNARLGWRVSDTFDVALRGQNLLNPRHREFAAPDGALVERSLFAEWRWAF
jgi:iron complex outermembrane receptor protein